MPNPELDEPFPDPDELDYFGEKPILAEGFTPGGAPYGLTLSEYREMSEQLDEGQGWARAKRAIRSVLVARGVVDPEIERVRHFASGLARDVYSAEVDGLWEGQYSTVVVAVIPHGRHMDRGEDRQARMLCEARLLEWLSERSLSSRVPRVVGVDREGSSSVAVLEYLGGGPADLRARKMPGGRPWELVASIAAKIHGLGVAGLDWLGGERTSRDHGAAIVAELACLEGAKREVVRDALAWVVEHLPPEEPAVLLHGDLLGQNIRMGIDFKDGSDDRPGVIDWEHASLGDPAYDLALITG